MSGEHLADPAPEDGTDDDLANAAITAGAPPPSSNIPERRLRYGTERTASGEPRYRGAVVFAEGSIELVPTHEFVFGDESRGHQGAIRRRHPDYLDDLVAAYAAGRLITVEAFRVLLDGVPTMRGTGRWSVFPDQGRQEMRALASAHGSTRLELRMMTDPGSFGPEPYFVTL